MGKYVAHAAALTKWNKLPPVVDQRGMSTLHWLRQGLGLKPDDAAAILLKPKAFVVALENRSHPMPDDLCLSAWGVYADWSARRLRRLDRFAGARPVKAEPIKPKHHRFGARELLDVQKLAYTAQESEHQRYERALRLLRDR